MTEFDYAPLPTEEQLLKLASEWAPGSVVTHERRIEGGLGCTMDVVSGGDGEGSAVRAVLRRYGPWGNPSDDHPAPVEAHVLALAERHGVPVPHLLWVDSHGVFEEPAVLISYIDGTPVTKPPKLSDWADQLAAAAARIHSVPLSDVDYEAIEMARPGSNDDGKTIPDELAPHPLGPQLWEQILQRRARLVPEESCLLHADFWPGNTLWRDGGLVAVVDWEHPLIGDPALDVAYAAMDMRYVGLGEAADRFVATYREMTGRLLPNLGYWTAIALARPMPDIARWHPSFVAFGHDLSADDLRDRHAHLIQRELLVERAS
ncbi:MAG: phosphotransferase [Acidimicrobiia bacterium]|nr:phosphotransferase [Acidimicrobiia bacterium]